MTTTASIQSNPERARFTGHESFPLRFGWLAKAVRLCEHDAEGFAQSDAMVDLGVGKNMVRSIRHWAIESQMIAPAEQEPSSRAKALQPTKLGSLFFADRGVDPYMEDHSTVWLVHWNLASRTDGPTLWYWLFNLLRETEFSKQQVIDEVKQIAARCAWDRLSDETISRDLDCCIRSYIPSDADKKIAGEDALDCPLNELDLIRRGTDRDSFVLQRAARPSLSARVVGYALLQFWKRRSANAKSISFDQVAYAPGSPGQVFKLSENALSDRLTALEELTRSGVTFGATAGLRQVYFPNPPESTSLLRPQPKSRKRNARN
ncbi:MAG: DUF4007 family protein [Phycisphaerales bacterium]|nr:DUF4007 family protein [Phycisphaerales bacterium]